MDVSIYISAAAWQMRFPFYFAALLFLTVTYEPSEVTNSLAMLVSVLQRCPAVRFSSIQHARAGNRMSGLPFQGRVFKNRNANGVESPPLARRLFSEPQWKNVRNGMMWMSSFGILPCSTGENCRTRYIVLPVIHTPVSVWLRRWFLKGNSAKKTPKNLQIKGKNKIGRKHGMARKSRGHDRSRKNKKTTWENGNAKCTRASINTERMLGAKETWVLVPERLPGLVHS